MQRHEADVNCLKPSHTAHLSTLFSTLPSPCFAMLRRQGLSQLSFLENATFPRRTKGPLVFQRHDFDLNNVINFGCGSMMPQRRWAESIRRSAISTYKSRSFSHTASLYVDSAQNSSPPSGYTDDWDPGLMALRYALIPSCFVPRFMWIVDYK